jgi:DNA-binding transcriptional MerR regulator
MKLISAKEIVKEFGISYQTVNNYTDLELLDVTAKKNHKRLYNYAQVKERLPKISKWVAEGYTLRLIRKMLKQNRVSSKG